MQNRPAIILAADTNGLGAVRSLHAAGVPTIVLATTQNEPAMHSRLPVGKALLDPALPLDKALYEALEPNRAQSPVVIATSDRFVAAVDRLRDRLPPEFHCGPLNQRLSNALIDKASEVELISRTGAELPRSIARPTGSVAETSSLGYPVIVKPRDYEHYRYLGRKNLILRDQQEAAVFAREHKGEMWRFILQEVIPGDDQALWVCNCVLNQNHEVASAHVFRRLKTSPAHYGVTSYAVSESNMDVLNRVKTLGSSLRYSGPAMVEFKYDFRDGSYRYLEINPRVGLCNYFDTRSGMNTVLATYRLYSEGELAPMQGRQKCGVMYLSFQEDIYARRKDGESLLGVLRDYLGNSLRPHTFAYFAPHDPWPWVQAVLKHGCDMMRAVLRRLNGFARLRRHASHEGSAQAPDIPEPL